MKVYIDGSNSFCTSRNTGIERVVRKLAENLEMLAHEEPQLTVSRVIHFRGKFSSLTPSLNRELGVLAGFEKNPTCFMPRSMKSFFDKLTNYLNSKKLRSLVLPESSHLGIYNLPFKLAKLYVLQKWFRQADSIEWSDGDVLFLPDAYWTRRDIWETVNAIRNRGVNVVSLFYDLIPITHVEFVGQRRSEKFRRYVHDLLTHSDLILAISNTVRDELIEYADKTMERGSVQLSKIKSIRLGADISETSGLIRDELRSLFQTSKEFGNTRPYVVVGSLDPRKNHLQVLEAFEFLQRSGNPRRLFFVGRAGGCSQGILERMEASPLQPSLLRHLCDLTDAELHYVYRNIEAAIMPSVVEGFGLPIVEALWHGNTIYASDIPIHREVGKEECRYFPLHQPEMLAQIILDNEQKCAHLPRRRALPTTWMDSAKQVISHCGFQPSSQELHSKVA